MRQLPVSMMDLESAMEFSSDFNEGPQMSYLDLQTGRILWIWESDEDAAAVTNEDPEENQRAREVVQSQPDRFVEIPEFDTIDDNEMLREFLRSDWTDDEARRQTANEAYRGSVGRWKHAVRHNLSILYAWRGFEQQALRRRALRFLAEHNIEPIDVDGT